MVNTCQTVGRYFSTRRYCPVGVLLAMGIIVGRVDLLCHRPNFPSPPPPRRPAKFGNLEFGGRRGSHQRFLSCCRLRYACVFPGSLRRSRVSGMSDSERWIVLREMRSGRRLGAWLSPERDNAAACCFFSRSLSLTRSLTKSPSHRHDLSLCCSLYAMISLPVYLCGCRPPRGSGLLGQARVGATDCEGDSKQATL